MNRSRIIWITQTALFIALLVSVQAVTRPLGQLPFGTLVTGSLVNFILVSACVLAGLQSAALVAFVSPMFAWLIFGIPVFPHFIPFIMVGNFVLVAVIYFVSGKSFEELNIRSYIRISLSVVIGAVLKFLVLWVGIVQIALTLIPDLSERQVELMSAAFSWPQLVTATIGSSLAVAVMPKLKKILKLAGKSES